MKSMFLSSKRLQCIGYKLLHAPDEYSSHTFLLTERKESEEFYSPDHWQHLLRVCRQFVKQTAFDLGGCWKCFSPLKKSPRLLTTSTAFTQCTPDLSLLSLSSSSQVFTSFTSPQSASHIIKFQRWQCRRNGLYIFHHSGEVFPLELSTLSQWQQWVYRMKTSALVPACRLQPLTVDIPKHGQAARR